MSPLICAASSCEAHVELCRRWHQHYLHPVLLSLISSNVKPVPGTFNYANETISILCCYPLCYIVLLKRAAYNLFWGA